MVCTDKIMRHSRAGRAVCLAVGSVVFVVALSRSSPARSAEFQITVQVRRGKQKVQAASEPPKVAANQKLVIKPRLNIRERNRPHPRPLLSVQIDQTVQVNWQVTASGTSMTFKNLLVHVFAVAETKAGQRQVPKLTKSAAYESALSMDFKPKDQAQGRFQLKFSRPGIYLVRVETIGLANKLEREFHAAVDVKVDRAAAGGKP